MEPFIKSEFSDTTAIAHHHHQQQLQQQQQQQQFHQQDGFSQCKKKLNFGVSMKSTKLHHQSMNALPITNSTGSLMHFKPSNTKRNERERKRVKTINDYFSKLQRFLPNGKQTTKKLSKVETLKAAIDYIEFLQLNNKISGNTMLSSTNLKLQKESRLKLSNKLNNQNNNNNNENSSSSASSVSSSLISTSSCYSTPTVSPLQISHSNNSNVLNNNTNNHNNIQVHVNINGSNLQVPPTQATPPTAAATPTPATAYTTTNYNTLPTTRTPTKPTASSSYYNQTSTPSTSPNHPSSYYQQLDEYSKSLIAANENYNNMQIYNNCQQQFSSQHFPVHQEAAGFNQQQHHFYQQQPIRLATASTPKQQQHRHLDYSTDDGIDSVNSSISTTNDYCTAPATYTTCHAQQQHLITQSNEMRHHHNYDVKPDSAYLAENIMIDFM